ncbi:hypothetical protein QBC43DRAFT_212340, partial [Cladorrhinum sp. PSN259]
SSLLPVDQLETRLDLIKRLEAFWQANFTRLTQLQMKNYERFTDLQIAALLEMDLTILHYASNINQDATLKHLMGLRCTMKIFATKRLSADNVKGPGAAIKGVVLAQPDVPSESSGDEAEKKTKYENSKDGKRARRNSFYIQKRKRLDNFRCIMTQTSNPEVCHIVPLSANASDAGMDLWRKCLYTIFGLGLMGTALLDRFESLFCSKLGVSDRHWNSICLAVTAHDFWSRGYFAFKYLGTKDPPLANPKSMVCLRIQLEWMPWRERDVEKNKPERSIGRSVDEFRTSLPEYENRRFPPHCGDYRGTYGKPLVALSRPETGFNIEDGDIFEVLVERGHMEKMISCFQLQRAMIRILAIAGGAEPQDDDYQPRFLDEDWEFPGIKEERKGKPFIVMDGSPGPSKSAALEEGDNEDLRIEGDREDEGDDEENDGNEGDEGDDEENDGNEGDEGDEGDKGESSKRKAE